MKPIRVEHWYEYLKKYPEFTGSLIDIKDDVAWYKDGLCHREDGLSALEWADGSKEWCKKGVLHREDGPAVEYVNGNKYWYLDGEHSSEQDYKIAMRKIKIEKVLKQISS